MSHRFSGKNGHKAVPYTSHISFDERDKTFRLYAGKSIYAFCISPELTLEHLHWGETLPAGYDLRYLSQSSRLTHFSTVEAAPDPFGGKIVLAAETLEEVQKTWRDNKVWGLTEMSDLERFQKRRLENYSWRIMSRILKDSAKTSNNNTTTNLKNIYPSKTKESNILSDKANQLDGYGFSDFPNLTANVATHTIDRKKIRYIPSEANLFRLKDEDEVQKKRFEGIVKPKFIEQLRTQNQQSKRRGAKQTFDRAIGKIGKGGICVEYSDFGTGDFRTPSFQVIDNFNGSSIAPLRYRKHRIYKGKLSMPDNLPGIRCHSDSEASTLVVTMADIISGLDVDLIFVCMHDYDVITRRAVFRNVDQRSNCSYNMMSSRTDDYACGASKVILKASSVTVDFESEATPFHLVQLAGR